MSYDCSFNRHRDGLLFWEGVSPIEVGGVVEARIQ
jgi:hypothetical protein